MYESCIKRLLDLILSLAACVVLAIPMGIIALWIKKDSPGPVFFKQRRVGRGKKCFNILKFRTMRIDTPHDMPTHLLHDPDQYITRMGRFLRKTSLDELPQLLNVLRGDMSIVGPRPALPREVELYSDYQRQRLYVTPGLSCYWQIAPHRNEMSFDEWVALDLKYIQERSFWVDWKIIFLTVRAMFMKYGE